MGGANEAGGDAPEAGPPAPRLLLVSNSHCADEIRDFLGGVEEVLFVPYALGDLDGYAASASGRFAAMGLRLASVHRADDPRRAAAGARAFFVGGGNTFRLLARLYQLELLGPIRRRVAAGVPYVGSSAGSNVAGPTIKTTNDMPIVEPPSFAALGLLPFQLNPHYLDPDPASTHMGETREQRIVEYHEENELPVVGLREGAMLRVEGGSVTLLGSSGARLFRRGAEPVEAAPGARLDELLNAGAPPAPP